MPIVEVTGKHISYVMNSMRIINKRIVILDIGFYMLIRSLISVGPVGYNSWLSLSICDQCCALVLIVILRSCYVFTKCKFTYYSNLVVHMVKFYDNKFIPKYETS